MAGDTKGTRDHETIRKWVEERGGRPATVKDTAPDHEAGILRIEFPGAGDDERLQPISWDEFFKKFAEKQLTFLYQDKTRDGKESRFWKFVREPEPARKS